MKRIDHYRQSVLYDLELTTAEKLLLLAFAEFMDFDSLGGAHPGKEKLGRMTSLGLSSVKRVMSSVADKGWLIETHRGGSPKGGRRMASVYRGDIPDRAHGGPSTRAMVDADRGHGGPPPSKDPRRPDGLPARAGARAPKTHKSRTSANGSTPCGVDGCDGWHHTLTDPVQPCPQRRTA